MKTSGSRCKRIVMPSLWCSGLLLASMALTVVLSSKTSPVTASPMRGLYAEEVDQMVAMREAGLAGDRSQVNVMLAALSKPLSPHPLVIKSVTPNFTIMVTEHPLYVRATLHALAQLGETRALPLIDSGIQDHSLDEAYARVARARLLAESSALSVPPAERAATKISRFYKELQLTPGDINASSSHYLAVRQSMHGDNMPSIPMEVYAMREIADMAYTGSYTDYAAIPGVSQIQFASDYPSLLKIRIASLQASQRPQALSEELSQVKSRGDYADYTLQLAIDQGSAMHQAAETKLQDMRDNPLKYSAAGLELVLTAANNSGDSQQRLIDDKNLSQSGDPMMAHLAKQATVEARAGHTAQTAPGY